MARRPTKEKNGYDDSRFEKTVDAHFHCSVCYNVLKEPVMCRNNEHIFCRGCITEHLTVNSHTCPECNEYLTVETLRNARLVSNYLSELKIKCDYSDRGCREYVRLGDLKSHVEDCGLAPVKCSNEQCNMLVNKREIIYHESTMCEYRKVKCHNCVKIQQEMEGMKKQMEAMDKDVKVMMVHMFEKLRFLENTIQISSAVNHASNAFMADIFVAGGWDEDGNIVKSVERFSWEKNVWEKVPSVNFCRKGATSFVYEYQLFVAGGCDHYLNDVLDLNEDPHQYQWVACMAIMPFCCKRTRSVVYQDRAILFCACKTHDCCAELSLTAPYECKQLRKLPEPARINYTVVAFEQKVLIFGGRSAPGAGCS